MAAKKADSGKVVPAVPLSHQGSTIPMDTDLRELLEEHQWKALIERGEAAFESMLGAEAASGESAPEAPADAS